MLVKNLSYSTVLSVWLLQLASAIPQPHSSIVRRQDATGNLSFDGEAEPLTFEYTTSQPNESNWIGLWLQSGGGPENQESEEPSLVWEYAPEAQGEVLLAVDDLEPGDYKAFLLAQDGYEWLAEPVEVTFEGLPADLSFPTDEATLHNARQFEQYEAHVGGLLLGQGRSAVTFEKSSGNTWIEVSSDGVISGTPDESCSQRSKVEIRATAENGSTATIKLKIPVRKADQRLVEDIAVMSYNMWSGGANVEDYHEKQLRFILESNVDVIGLQEAASGNHTRRLGQALGWDYWQSNWSVGIVSRYPIVEEYGAVNVSGGVRINLNGEGAPSEVNLWNAHLGSDPYGPYDFCFFNMTGEEVLENEVRARRVPQMTVLLEAIQSQLANSHPTPVILTGDMNAPSHLDWTDALRDVHCGIGDFPWPTSVLPIQAGLLDSFRVANPDPATEPGNTWSTIFLGEAGYTELTPEPQDRIDYVYATEELKVVDSQMIAADQPQLYPNHEENEWTSDHYAVLTRFRLP